MAGSQPLRIGPQAGPQAELIACPAQEIFYGGARGGGKSFGVLLDWLEHARRYGARARGILFRRTLGELEDIIDKSQGIYPPLGAVYREQRKIWRSNNGACLRLRFLDRDSHAQRYQGHEYTWMAFDEAGNWPNPRPLDKLRACLRSAHGVPPRLLLTGNPGGPGHQWLKSRFVDPAPAREARAVSGAHGRWHRVFIPARVSDNKLLMKNDPGYLERLKQSGPAWLVKAWLEGDWSVAAGGALSDLWQEAVHVLPPFPIPTDWPLDRSLDWGSARPFSVGWWAQSNGEASAAPHGQARFFPAGTLIRVAELYGYNGSPDQGCRLPADQAARRILDLEREHPLLRGRAVRPGPADPAIYADTGGETIADMMARAGLSWVPAAKGPGSRKAGLEALRRRLAAGLADPVEEPAIYVLDTCRHFIRTVPILPRDPADPEDVDTACEDHIYDETRYRLMTPERSVGRLKILGV